MRVAPSKDRLALWIVGGEMKLEPRIQVVSEKAIHLVWGGANAEEDQLVQALDKLHVLLRHRPRSIPRSARRVRRAPRGVRYRRVTARTRTGMP